MERPRPGTRRCTRVGGDVSPELNVQRAHRVNLDVPTCVGDRGTVFNMTAAQYFFDDGQARKFWSYTVRGKKQTLRYGRIGTKGRDTSKVFSSPSAAKAATEKLVDQKIAKGYVQVNPGQLKIARPKGKRAATEAQVAKLEKRLAVRLPND